SHLLLFFFFSSRRRHTRFSRDWSSDVCSSDLDEALNEFLLRHAKQSHDKGGAKTYLAVSESIGKVLGYYSLSPASIAYERVPERSEERRVGKECRARGSRDQRA